MICAVIPTRYQPPELFRLLAVLLADGICVHLTIDSDDSEHRLHRMWNKAAAEARAHGAKYIAVLNDDITILPGSLRVFERALDAYEKVGLVHPDLNAPWGPLPGGTPAVTVGPILTGACFMFRASIMIPFDESLHFWYGDQQFDRDLRKAGWAIGRVKGVPYRHKPEVSTRKAWDYLGPIVARDEQIWQSRGGTDWGLYDYLAPFPQFQTYGSSYR